MKAERSVLTILLLGVALLAGIVAIISANSRSNSPNGLLQGSAGNGDEANNGPYPKMGPHNMAGASPKEGAAAAQHFGQVMSRDNKLPQMLLVTPITRDGFTALGLGCIVDFASYETPPLVL